ncbi:hypothetical protein [Longimicrobium sp.]|uniref:hypothetical protein n=1 Tax=Longimicrobium sp. TaxID=2029185 RepID=UPI002ED8B09F
MWLEQTQAPRSAGACVVMRGSEVPTPLKLARRAAEQGMGVVTPHGALAPALELLARTVRLVIAGVRLLNGYGPTEAWPPARRTTSRPPKPVRGSRLVREPGATAA